MPILDLLIKKIDECKNDLEKSFTTKTGEHIVSGYSIFTICAFDYEKVNMIYIEKKIP